jgi:hypothetical protein
MSVTEVPFKDNSATRSRHVTPLRRFHTKMLVRRDTYLVLTHLSPPLLLTQSSGRRS